MPPILPFNFTEFRVAMVREVQRVTGLKCIREEPVTPNSPRPALPYFSFKVTSPGTHFGYASQVYTGTDTTFLASGQRRASVSFHCYAPDQEAAYNYMSLWQMALDMIETQTALRESGIAVWTIGDVADLSQLLNTGYEGRSQLDATFGIAFNKTEDLGTIETIEVEGTIDIGAEEVEQDFTIEDEG